MTRIVTPGEAQRLLDAPNSPQGSFDWDSSYINTYGTAFIDAVPDLAHTVIQQAEQIKRLQKALREADGWVDGLLEQLITIGIVTDKDMNL